MGGRTRPRRVAPLPQPVLPDEHEECSEGDAQLPECLRGSGGHGGADVFAALLSTPGCPRRCMDLACECECVPGPPPRKMRWLWTSKRGWAARL